MMPTVIIHGSNGEVMAPIGRAGVFIPGKRVEIVVTAISPDETTPLSVRQALVGMSLSAIFTKEQLGDQFTAVPDGSRLAYSCEVIEALEAAGKKEAADDLRIVAGNEFDMYVFEPGTFEVVH